MSNRVALFLGIVLVAVVAANFYFDWQAHIFLGRKFIELIDVVAFWR